MSAQRKTPAEVKFSNLEKVFFPATGFTKGEMIRYYLDVAPFLLPHLRRRPVTLVRFPDGVTGEKFYEKNAPRFTPPWVDTVAVSRRHHPGEINYLLIDNAATLAWCANLAAIELHPFLHRAPALARPTHLAFDLDPGEGADLLTCIEVAFLVKQLTDALHLEIFPKVSGSKGLQLYLPLNTPVTYEATSAFAEAVAELLAQQHPDLIVSRMPKVRRQSRVLIDWSQNSPAKTTVAVYSMRGKRDQPFVSTPVTWAELKKAGRGGRKESLDFDPTAVRKRLAKIGDLFAPVLKLKQRLPRDFARAAATTTPAVTGSSAPVILRAYRAKRDFSKTAEPPPSRGRQTRSESGTGRFVIQKHAASHLHYDFRLEMDGTLKSWAIPKGVPTELGVKYSAFAVEDHPLDYLRFEGTIPRGQYGGGTVMVWDIGTYRLLSGSHESGRLKLWLEGHKLKGEWNLFKIRSKDGKDVWLITKSGQAAKPISRRRDDRSAISRRSMARIAAADDAEWSTA